jgi:hypothetical protein
MKDHHIGNLCGNGVGSMCFNSHGHIDADSVCNGGFKVESLLVRMVSFFGNFDFNCQ